MATEGEVSRPHRHVVLIGTMGSGKSTVGRLVASELGWPFWDNDEQLMRREGRTAEEIASEDGATHLHDLEADILLADLAREESAVVAAAASTVLDPRARARLRADGFVFWLRTAPSALDERLAHPGDRPSFDTSPAQEAGSLQTDRSELYRAVADHELDTTSRRPDEIASLILAEHAARPEPGSTKPPAA